MAAGLLEGTAFEYNKLEHMPESKRIAVVGAGIAGLACAYELQRAGCEVVVFEKEARVGGRMSSRVMDGFVFDLGADHLCELYDGIKKYSDEFGIPMERMRFLEYGMFRGGKIIPLSDAISRVSKFRLALTYFFARNAGDFFDLTHLAEHDRDNAYNFMRLFAGQDVSDYFVDAFTSTYQFHRSTEISLGALFGIMRSIKKDHPRWFLCRTVGGMQALPDAFAARLNVKVNTEVSSLHSSYQSHRSHVSIRTTYSEDSFDAAVLACQAPMALAMLQNPTEAQRQMLSETQYASTISVAFRVPRSRLPDTAVVWVPFVESQKISGYVNEAMKGEQLVHDGQTLICTWLHEDFAKTLMDKTNEKIFAAVKDEFVRVCPWVSADDLTAHDLQKWPLAMPKFAHGHLTMIKKFLSDPNGQGANNIFFAGDYLNSPWTEGALRNGQRIAADLLKRVDRADESSPHP